MSQVSKVTSSVLYNITSVSNVSNVFSVIGIIHVTIITSVSAVPLVSPTLLYIIIYISAVNYVFCVSLMLVTIFYPLSLMVLVSMLEFILSLRYSLYCCYYYVAISPIKWACLVQLATLLAPILYKKI